MTWKCVCRTPDWPKGSTFSDPQCTYCELVTSTDVERPRTAIERSPTPESFDSHPAERRHMLIVTINNAAAYFLDIDQALLERAVGAEAVARAAVIFITEPSINIGRVFRDDSSPDETLLVSTAAIG